MQSSGAEEQYSTYTSSSRLWSQVPGSLDPLNVSSQSFRGARTNPSSSQKVLRLFKSKLAMFNVHLPPPP